MVTRNYAGALALSAVLLGCSAETDSNYQKQEPQSVNGWIYSPTPSPVEEDVMNKVLSALEGKIEPINDPLRGKRVSLLYATNDGPRSEMENYTGGRPVNSGLLDNVRNQLRESRAYVLEEGVFMGKYGQTIEQSRRPRMSSADFIVIADESPQLPVDLNNVYIVQKNGNEYKLVEAKR